MASYGWGMVECHLMVILWLGHLMAGEWLSVILWFGNG